MLQRYNNNKRHGYIRFISFKWSENKTKRHRIISYSPDGNRWPRWTSINYNEAALNYLTFIFARWQWFTLRIRFRWAEVVCLHLTFLRIHHPYLCQNAKTLNAKLSQQVNLNHSDLSKYSMRNTVFCFIIAHDYDPTVVRTIIQFRHFPAV